MKKIMIANPKGGSGKSTLAVHLASWFARGDEVVYLGDMDRQQSSRYWLSTRPSGANPIEHWPVDDDGVPADLPKRCTVAILDTPAGLHGKALKQLLSEMDRVIVPVTPSRFDMQASEAFFAELAETKAVRKEKVSIGMVGMRVTPRTLASQQLMDFLAQFDLPLVTCIRAAQRYVAAVESGLTLFDQGMGLGEIEEAQWRPLLDWLQSRRKTD